MFPSFFFPFHKFQTSCKFTLKVNGSKVILLTWMSRTHEKGNKLRLGLGLSMANPTYLSFYLRISHLVIFPKLLEEKSLAILRSSPEQATANLASGEFTSPSHMRHIPSVGYSRRFGVSTFREAFAMNPTRAG